MSEEAAGQPEQPEQAEQPGGRRRDRAVLVACLVAVGVFSAVLAVVESFYSPAQPRVVGVPVPYGVVAAVVGNLAVGYLGARLVGTRLAPAVSFVVWLVVVLYLGSQRPEGDLVITGRSPGPAFLLLGLVAAALPLGLLPARRLAPGAGAGRGRFRRFT